MALFLEFREYTDLARLPGQREPLPTLPPLRVRRLAAAGSLDITDNGRVFTLVNKADPALVRLNLDADNIQAAAGDAQTIHLSTGETFDFALDSQTQASAYKLDVRAA